MAIEIHLEKTINNLRVIREADNKHRREYLSLTCLFGFLLVCLLFYGWQHYRWIQNGYLIEAAQKRRAQLEETAHQLRLERASLRDFERIEKIAYESFDFETMSKLVIARYWQQFTPEQRKQFIAEFKTLLSSTYGDRIERYNQEKVVIVGERPETRGDMTVMTRIEGGEFTGAEVDYRLREISGAWRIIDVKVEGISLVLNYRDQFKSLLSQGGADNLLEKLREKNAEI